MSRELRDLELKGPRANRMLRAVFGSRGGGLLPKGAKARTKLTIRLDNAGQDVGRRASRASAAAFYMTGRRSGEQGPRVPGGTWTPRNYQPKFTRR